MVKFFNFNFVDFNQDRLADIIHRGRDHGLPTYKQVREFCGLSPITDFHQLNTTIEDHVIENLRRTYKVFEVSKSAKNPSRKSYVHSKRSVKQNLILGKSREQGIFLVM